jgi:hypothetical protein
VKADVGFLPGVGSGLLRARPWRRALTCWTWFEARDGEVGFSLDGVSSDIWVDQAREFHGYLVSAVPCWW